MIMTICELIERLEEYRDEFGDIEVRLMTQSHYPFENTIAGLASGAEINAAGDEDDPEDDGDVDDDNVLYIVEGRQLGYGTKGLGRSLGRPEVTSRPRSATPPPTRSPVAASSYGWTVRPTFPTTPTLAARLRPRRPEPGTFRDPFSGSQPNEVVERSRCTAVWFIGFAVLSPS